MVRDPFLNHPRVREELRRLGIPEEIIQVDHPFALILMVNLLDAFIHQHGTDSMNITTFIAVREILHRTLTAEMTHGNAWANYFDQHIRRGGNLVDVPFIALRQNPLAIRERLQERLNLYNRLPDIVGEEIGRLRLINQELPVAGLFPARLREIIRAHPDYQMTVEQLRQIETIFAAMTPEQRAIAERAFREGRVLLRGGQIGGNRTNDLIQYIKGILMLYFGDAEFSFDNLNTYFITLPKKNTNNYPPLPVSPRNNNNASTNNNSNSPLPNYPPNVSELPNLSLTPLSSITVPEITHLITQKDIDDATVAMLLSEILINLEQNKFNADDLSKFLELMGIQSDILRGGHRFKKTRKHHSKKNKRYSRKK
jgi:hypothetical protein